LCRYRDGYFEVGSRPDSRDTFLCLSKEKYPKETTPYAAYTLRSSLLNEVAERGSCPFVNAIHPCIAPSGYFVQKLRCSARHKGMKTVTHLMLKDWANRTILRALILDFSRQWLLLLGEVKSRMPCRAPELSARLAREGSGRRPLVGRGPRMALLSTLVESEERRIEAASGSPFLWILSLGDAKESISAVGPRTDV